MNERDSERDEAQAKLLARLKAEWEHREHTPPTIAGQPARWDEHDPLIGLLSHWTCPICGAHLAYATSFGGGIICLNACHLGQAGQERFITHLRTAMERNKEADDA